MKEIPGLATTLPARTLPAQLPSQMPVYSEQDGAVQDFTEYEELRAA
jgi:hypothetical protein